MKCKVDFLVKPCNGEAKWEAVVPSNCYYNWYLGLQGDEALAPLCDDHVEEINHMNQIQADDEGWVCSFPITLINNE